MTKRNSIYDYIRILNQQTTSLIPRDFSSVEEMKKSGSNWLQVSSITLNLFLIFVATGISCLSGQALLESGSALLNIVGLEPEYETITYFICILSSIFLVVAAMLSFIAIFAVKTSKWITLYITASMIPFALNISNLVLLYKSFNYFEAVSKHFWPVRAITLLQDYSLDETITSMLDQLQTEGQCCGMADWSEFNSPSVPWGQNSLNLYLSVPSTCCRTDGGHLGSFLNLSECQKGTEEFIHKEGCHAKVNRHIQTAQETTKILSLVLLGLLLLQLIAAVMSFISWRNGKSTATVGKTVIVQL